MTLWFALFAQESSPDLMVAFIGDQGMGDNSRTVLELIKSEGAHAVLHQGDFDYGSNPERWEKQIDSVLGEDFPYFACVGNNDLPAWGGYQKRLRARLERLKIVWDGDVGIRCSFMFRGLFLVFVAPGIKGERHAQYIRERLDADRSLWRICSWHCNQRLMQVGLHDDEAGWDVYEEARKGGAIIATAHEHSYSRSHLLTSCVRQTVLEGPLRIAKGQTFVFVSGLGGDSIRSQSLSGPWWAKIYTSTQNAQFGALFGVFHVDGDPKKARFYFKNIKGQIIDRFDVWSGLGD